MSIVDDWFPDVWACAEARRIDESSFFFGWAQVAVVASASMFFVNPRTSIGVQSGVIVVPVLGVLLLKPRLDRSWSHGRAGSIDGQLRVAVAITVLAVCIGLAAALVRSFNLTVSVEPTLFDAVGFFGLLFASCVATGHAAVAGLLPGGAPRSVLRLLRRARVVALLGALVAVGWGAAAYVRRDARFDHYLSSLPEVGRLPWPAKGEPWQSVGAVPLHRYVQVGAFRVCALGVRVAVVRVPGAPCDELRGPLVAGTGNIVLREDTSRNTLFVQLQGAEPREAVAFVGHELRHLAAVPHDWLGPRRPPGPWPGLSAVGVVVALLGVARGARARRQASDSARWRPGSVTNRGTFVFDDGDSPLPLPHGTKTEVGPAVWVVLSPTRHATYRAHAQAGDARVVPGTVDDEADAARDATALAVLAMTSAPLLAALCVG